MARSATGGWVDWLRLLLFGKEARGAGSVDWLGKVAVGRTAAGLGGWAYGRWGLRTGFEG